MTFDPNFNRTGPIAIPLPSSAEITLTPSKGDSVTAMLDENMPKVVGGYGGWTTIPRNRRVALTTWTGVDPLSISFGIILNALGPYSQVAPGKTIEDACAHLSYMALPNRALNQRPPTIKVDSPGNLPFDEKTWVISNLTWGEGYRQPDTGLRVRAYASLTLLELVEDDTFSTLSPAKTARSAAIPAGSFAVKGVHIVRAGETLQSIAAKATGKASDWRKLAKLNDIRDPLAITVGQAIKLS